MKTRLVKVSAGEQGTKKLSGSGYVGAKYPRDGVTIDGRYIPWDVLDGLRDGEEMEVEFDPWEEPDVGEAEDVPDER